MSKQEWADVRLALIIPIIALLLGIFIGRAFAEDSIEGNFKRTNGNFWKWLKQEVSIKFDLKNQHYGSCVNCGRNWASVRGHTIEIDGDSGTFSLCEDCFYKLSIKDIAYYLRKDLKKSFYHKKYISDCVYRACIDKYSFAKTLYENDSNPNEEKKPMWFSLSDEKENIIARSVCFGARKQLTNNFKYKADFEYSN